MSTHCKLSIFQQVECRLMCFSSASVYSRDLFETKFSHDPLNVAEGRRYRRVVLERGGSRPEMSLLEEYLGRRPNGLAFSKALKSGA